MQSPYSITPLIIDLVAAISEKIGEANANHLDRPPAGLRESNRIKTVQATLGIEGSVLSTDQIRAIIENKPVNGPAKCILEVKNTLEAYNRLDQFKATSLSSLLRAHKLMMAGLIDSPGKLRARHRQITGEERPAYAALEGKMVKPFLLSLFEYLRNSRDLILIKSCLFHYELDSIQPFTVGNGRIGRLWQTIILREHYAVFEFLPVETIIWREKDRYFEMLNKNNFPGKSTGFIEFMLGAMLESLKELLSGRFLSLNATERIERYRAEIGDQPFSRKGYLGKYKNISTATASRDLRDGVKRKILERTGDKRNASYRFVSA